jgi:crotonobetainyl-CoA:carnitine CoA-transferase CaiB-like acyl-CoA transferase
MSDAALKGPLDGIRIVDWTIWQQGPVAGAMLDDTGKSPYWEMNNRNKKSLAIDLKNPEGVELVRQLIAKADVFIQNFRPSVADKIGLGYERLKALNPRLIYASASAFGPQGPEARARAYDLLGQARSGLLLQHEDQAEPSTGDGGMADQMGAIMLAYGVLAGLMAREKHGLGQRVDTSLLGSMMWLRALPFVRELMQQDGKQAVSEMSKHRKSTVATRTDPGNPLWNSFKCSDGKWLALAILTSDPHWPTVLEALGNPVALASDARFADHWSRCMHAREATAILDLIFAAQSRDYWLARFMVKGELPVCAINTTAEAACDAQALLNGYITELDHPVHGTIKLPGFPVTLSATPARIHRQAPEFGEHTEEILIDMLGLNWDEVSALRAKQII